MTLSNSNRPSTTRIHLNEAVNKLSRFFGLYTAKDLAGRIALQEIQGLSNNSSFGLAPPSPEVTKLIELMIDTSTGAHTTRDLVRLLNEAMSEAQQGQGSNTANSSQGGSITTRVNDLIQIFYGEGDDNGNQNTSSDSTVLKGSANRRAHAIKTILALAKRNEDMYLFSPYDVERIYGVPFADISVTEKYYEMVDNPHIRKTKNKTREFVQTVD